ncbi:hypothetical protein BGZ65_004400 [Modicella reniformis]|uniref:Uncharacterized protein n=1 Tax=Modicella reniformis TaxID=1440133 RepID=A0A9P6J0H1_9FUNG|nr:hypothetical protein BGZ65_004400 [Modicella reniformis]
MPFSTRHSRVAALLFSLTIACCLLLSSCSAKPVPKRNARQHQQRTIAQQVHHVQIADESVHNTLILLQKQKHQKLRLQRQQDLKHEQKKKRHQSQKRQFEAAEPGHATKMTLSKATTTTTNVTDKESSHAIISSNTVSKIKSTSSTTTKAQREKLISAYESIVFSESQIPVFLSQDHQRQQRFRKGKNKHKRQNRTTASSSSASHMLAPGDTDNPSSVHDMVYPKINKVIMIKLALAADSGTRKLVENSSNTKKVTQQEQQRHESGIAPGVFVYAEEATV